MTVIVEVADKTAGRAELRGHRERLGCVRKASAAVAEKDRGPEGVAALDAHLYEIANPIASDIRESESSRYRAGGIETICTRSSCKECGAVKDVQTLAAARRREVRMTVGIEIQNGEASTAGQLEVAGIPEAMVGGPWDNTNYASGAEDEITDTVAVDVHHRRIFQNLRRSLRRDRNPLDRRMTVLDANDDQGTVFDRHEFLCAVAVDVHGLE